MITLSHALSDITIKTIQTDVPPVIDGYLKDQVWQDSPGYSGFKTLRPEYGRLISEKTIVKMAYDSENLFFAFQCYDSQPDQIVASITKWDNAIYDDNVVIFLDSFNDQQNIIGFFVNPLGSQGDMIVYSSGKGDMSPDFIWDAAGLRTNDGFNIEVKLPLKSIRYTPGDKVLMGIGFGRSISRTSEMAAFPEILPDAGPLNAQMAEIELQDLSYQKTYEILPSFTKSIQSSTESGELAPTLDEDNLGVTAKVGLTPQLTLDATYNPDFSQVEADVGYVDVNLRYDIFYPEKRPFFMEGQENFMFGGLYENSSIRTVVHTRNIVNPDYGMKLTGKIGRSNSISTLVASDRVQIEDTTLTKNANFGIARYKRLFSSDTYVGGLVTSRDFEGSFNRIAGVDSRIRVTNNMKIEGNYLFSSSRDSTDGLIYDGYSVDLLWNYSSEKYLAYLSMNDVSASFDIQSGYIRRTGVSTASYLFSRTFYPGIKIFQSIQPMLWGYFRKDKDFNLDENFTMGILRFYFPYSTQLRFDVSKGSEVYEGELYDISKVRIDGLTSPTKWFFLMLQFRAGGSPNYDPEDLFQGDGESLMTLINFQLTEKFNSDFRYSRSILHKRETDELIYDYKLYTGRLTYQINKYLFIRGILEYNAYYEKLSTDFLISFTYIPGTVVHLGYGSLYEVWDDEMEMEQPSNRFIETKRGTFFKASYNWRI